MALSCIDTNSYKLTYQVGGYIEYLKVAKKFYSSGFIQYHTPTTASSFNGSLTYEIEEDTLTRRYVNIGTFIEQSLGGRGQIQYFMHLGYSEEQAENLRYFAAFGKLHAQYSLKPDMPGANREPSGSVFLYNESTYNLMFSEDVDRPPGAYFGYEVYDAIAYGDSAPYPAAAELNITKLARFGYSTWVISVYEDSVLLNTYRTTAWRDDRYSPNPELIDFRQVKVKRWFTKEFTKAIGVQGVEVLSVEGQPHKKKLWLVDVDEEGSETGRESIFEFELLPDQGIPSHSIQCLEPIQDTCPEGTWTLECGDTTCCYQDDGYSIYQFPTP